MIRAATPEPRVASVAVGSDLPRALTTPCGDRAREAERVADRDHKLADGERVRVTEFGGIRRLPSRADHGQIGQRIGADNGALDTGTIGEFGCSRPRAPDDVRVGQQEPVRRENDSGPQALPARDATARYPQARDPGRELRCYAGNDLRIRVKRRCHAALPKAR